MPDDTVRLTAEEREMLLTGLGWALSEGALDSEDVLDLVVKLGRSREDWTVYGLGEQFDGVVTDD